MLVLSQAFKYHYNATIPAANISLPSFSITRLLPTISFLSSCPNAALLSDSCPRVIIFLPRDFLPAVKST